MTRQRIHLRTPALAWVPRILTIILALALVWYGLQTVLLAVKVSSHTVNSISAYRTLYNDVAGLTHGDFTTPVLFIVGFGGFLAFLLFIYLAIQELPRPYLARGEMRLGEDARGTTVIKPRAIERLAELAARGNSDVTAASGRLDDRELNVSIGVKRATTAAQTLRDIRGRVRTELVDHELPELPVNVTLTGYDRKTRRELS
jgi:hypothetical protein